MSVKPSENEEQYFKAQELKARLERLAQKQQAETAEQKRQLREQHWMHCPKCGHDLDPEQYGNVEVDVCPCCKGLWLDAQELDAIIAGARRNSFFRGFLKALGN